MELKILTFNFWGLAFISKDRAPRLAALGATLARGEYDIVCLQELWIHAEYESLRHDIQAAYPYSRFFHTGALGSGLAIFSQHPITESHALPYSLSGVPHQVIQGDFYVNKAAARVTVRHARLGEIEVWNTHMHAAGEDGPDTAQAHRMAQAWQLATEVRRGARGGRYVFAMGDFNSQPWSIPIALLRGYGGLRDSFVEAHPQANDPLPNISATQALENVGMTCDSPLNTWSQGKPIPPNVTSAGGKRLDYIFYTPPLIQGHAQRGLRCSASKVVLTEHIPGREMSYSDHFGLASTFMLSDEPNPRPASQAPLLLDSASESSFVAPTAGGSVYELQRADSGSDGAIRAAITALHAYGQLARARTLRFSALVLTCIVAAVGLTVGSAWQPKAWIQPIFTLLAFALGAFGATMLYAGWLWGRWEKGLLDEVTSEMEEALRANEEAR
ncbi:DNase I-like protein [Cutaneotrichosporon oleaginosum]|uniref:DNase I-like protein n=1 Tax=Cutaneotrichosporon oleaginosum TaxID=879819 RepID=A0A0J0XXD0_9TREE|nr:DNase I-like protein [Cutaneotrichosporon oleaginosum]KLT45710.1 DNase I-like protein [Cutaneotrichosporon oleaginosum]TXT06189.1 hypothetical protein COLE_05520 [Cutaneotrichosporon oleaginosum]